MKNSRKGGPTVSPGPAPKKRKERYDVTFKPKNRDRNQNQGNGNSNVRTESNQSSTGSTLAAKQNDTRPSRSGRSFDDQYDVGKPGASGKKSHPKGRSNNARSTNSKPKATKGGTQRVSRQLSVGGTDSQPDRIRKPGSLSRPSRSDQRGKSSNVLPVTSLVLKTWRALITEISPSTIPHFDRSINDRGLTGTIIWCSELADLMIHSEIPSDPLMYELFMSLPSSLAKALQICRFAKRYSPGLLPDKEKEVVSDFLARNNRAKLWDRKEFPTFLRQVFTSIKSSLFGCMLHGRSFGDLMSERAYDRDWDNLPSGTTAEGLRNPFEKWLYLQKRWNRMDSMILAGIKIPDCLPDSPSIMRLVPKDFRAPRIILEEPLERTLMQTIVADALHRIITTKTISKWSPSGRITLDDQTLNQSLAAAGARYGYHATIDLRNASDCITTNLLYLVFPDDVAESIVKNASNWVQLPDGRTKPLYIPCTMGSRVTVPAQSLAYWVIICAAVKVSAKFGLCTESVIHDCAVYNDDIVVPSCIYDVVCELLTTCGLVVNDYKSFTGESSFRESCGLDQYEDEIVTSIYWPRREVSCDSTGILSLCSLQNRLYTAGYEQAAAVLTKQVKAIMPNVPVHHPHFDSNDTCLYGSLSTIKVTPYLAKAVLTPTRTLVYSIMVTVVTKTFTICYFNNDGSTEEVEVNLPSHLTQRPLKVLVIDSRPFSHQLVHSRELAECTYMSELYKPIYAKHYTKIDLIYHKETGFRSYTDLVFDGNNTVMCYTPQDQSIPNFYSVSDHRIVQTFNNRLCRPGLLDKAILSDYQVNELKTRYQLELFLKCGPEYFDETCELLHVSQKRDVFKRLTPDGYKVVSARYTIYRDGITIPDDFAAKFNH